MKSSILIVDDEVEVGEFMVRGLREADFDVVNETNPEVALDRLKRHPFDVLITDLRMPRIDGIEVIRRAHAIRPECEVLLMTAYATVDTARQALKLGAADYITKPFSLERDLIPLLQRIVATDIGDEVPNARYRRPVRTLLRKPRSVPPIIGHGRALYQAMDRARKVATADTSVLITGESGSGKELFADLIHRFSKRRNRPMIRINCAALPDTLLESELFGYIKGAFTGAQRDRPGVFQAADGGTIFLDEIGEISPAFQPKLLRVLQEGEFHRIGDAQHSVAVDVRIIAATNRDLIKAVRSGVFRKDLFYRLNVIPIEVPTLREHIEDLPELIEHFARLYAPDREVKFAPEALKAMNRYDWPGNIRELSNAVEHAIVLGEAEEFGLEDLPVAIQDFALKYSADVPCPKQRSGLPQTLEEIEMNCILQTLHKTHYNRTRAAKLLGITRRRLGYRIVKYGLEQSLDQAQRAEESLQEALPMDYEDSTEASVSKPRS
jgi:DNA-binding NtrC family response regulator